MNRSCMKKRYAVVVGPTKSGKETGCRLENESESGASYIGLARDGASWKRMRKKECRRRSDEHEHEWVMLPTLQDDPGVRLEQGLCRVPWLKEIDEGRELGEKSLP